MIAMNTKYFVFSAILLQLFVSGFVQHCEGHDESQLNAPKRSKRWDDYIQSLKDAHEERRVRRQTGAHEWESDETLCISAEYTRYDALRRRASGLLAEPQDQRSCGNCWAFATAHTLTDQLNLSKGLASFHYPLLSTNFLTLCNHNTKLVSCGHGCCGANNLFAGLVYFFHHTAVSNACSPYHDPNVNCPKASECAKYPGFQLVGNVQCPKRCSDNTHIGYFKSYNFRGDDFFSRNIALLPRSNEEIMKLLREGFVVLAAMQVTDEFQNYKCGIYRDSGASSQRGCHAVEIVDYGRSSSGTNFWVVKNSWGTDMQENGYFRIAWGQLGLANEAIFGSLAAVALVPLNANFDKSHLRKISRSSDRIYPNHVSKLRLCTPTSVSNPISDEMVMSAVEFVQQQLLEMNLVSCRGSDAGGNAQNNNSGNSELFYNSGSGATVTELAFDSITSAEVQVVAGSNIDVHFSANVVGCEQTTVVDITADVFIDMDGMFRLDGHTITIRSTNSAKTSATSLFWPLLLFASVVAILGAAV